MLVKLLFALYSIVLPPLPPSPLVPAPAFEVFELDHAWATVKREYPLEASFVKHLKIEPYAGLSGFVFFEGPDAGTVIYVTPDYLVSKNRKDPDVLLVHELRHIHQYYFIPQLTTADDLAQIDARAEEKIYLKRRNDKKDKASKPNAR